MTQVNGQQLARMPQPDPEKTSRVLHDLIVIAEAVLSHPYRAHALARDIETIEARMDAAALLHTAPGFYLIDVATFTLAAALKELADGGTSVKRGRHWLAIGLQALAMVRDDLFEAMTHEKNEEGSA